MKNTDQNKSLANEELQEVNSEQMEGVAGGSAQSSLPTPQTVNQKVEFDGMKTTFMNQLSQYENRNFVGKIFHKRPRITDMINEMNN